MKFTVTDGHCCQKKWKKGAYYMSVAKHLKRMAG